MGREDWAFAGLIGLLAAFLVLCFAQEAMLQRHVAESCRYSVEFRDCEARARATWLWEETQ